MGIQTPDWVKHAIFYQIFPDRFARSQRNAQPRGITLKPWGSPPAEQGYQGGDLYGVVDKLDYLKELGITALYLNPIFSSASNHRYHTFDYYQVDPLLGGNDAFRHLLDEAHKRGMRVVIDGVFNHASRGFWQFHHILENGGNSPYIDWFHIHDWPLRPYVHDDSNPPNYEGWMGIPALPKFNTDNPGVRDFLLDVGRYWIEFGVDGWRLDVPNEIDDDAFWQDFRRVVKEANPEAYIVGEIWEDGRRWLQGDQFDAVMNYLITWPTLSFFGGKTLRPGYWRHNLPFEPIDAATLAGHVDAMYSLYDWEINYAQLNLLDSHDMARALWIVQEDVTALQLSTLLLMTLPGAPCIYYGDEIGMSGGDDPDCRGAFPWHNKAQWNEAMLSFYQQATALRHRWPVLRTGSFKPVYASGPLYAFYRQLDGQEAVVIFNADTAVSRVSLEVPALQATDLQQVWPEIPQSFRLENEQLTITIPARSAIVLMNTK